MAKRKTISKKTRFEVFKRDAFTCQYCGAKAPDAVLHCDHIHPVAEGGTNDIMNLVTACADCNGGKGARKLDDRSAVERQRAQLADLAERREQMEMMLAWRDDLQASTTSAVEEIADRISERGHWRPSETGRAHIRRWLKRFTIAEILYALDESFDSYLRYNGDKPDEASWDRAFNKIPAIASLRKATAKKPYIQKLAYVQAIMRRRFNEPYADFISVLEHIVLNYEVQPEELEEIAKVALDWKDFCAISGRTHAQRLKENGSLPTAGDPE